MLIMKENRKNTLKYFLFMIVCAFWTSILFILIYFTSSPILGIKPFLFIAFQFGLSCFASFLLLYILGLNKYVFAIVFPVFVLLGAVLSYYCYAFRITLTPMIIDATFNNDIYTSMDVISIQLIVYIIFCLLLSFLFVRYRFRNIGKINKWYFHLLAPIFCLLFLFNSNYRVSNSIFQRFPFHIYANVAKYIELKEKTYEVRINPALESVCDRNDSLFVVFVIGEALRSDHLSLNGYHRSTTPLLEQRDNVVSLPNIYSEYTHTNRSLPHILTRADSVYPERAFQETSFVPLFQACDFKTYWLANQEDETGFVAFMRECDVLRRVHPEKTVFTYDTWLDEDLLPLVDEIINEDDSPRKLFILHTIGSHWFYNIHFSGDFEIYKPTATSRIIKYSTQEEIINSYDNTVLYTDFFINSLISRFETKAAIVIYLSDHGEELGENGAWLHATGGEMTKRPASFVWYSQLYEERFPEKVEALHKNGNRYYRTDFLFHSILSAGDIPSVIISRDLDVFTETGD